MRKLRGIAAIPINKMQNTTKETTGSHSGHEIEVYVRTNEHQEPKLLKVPGNATVEELLKTLNPDGHADFHLFVEEDCDTKAHHERLCDVGIHHRHQVHCHKCKSIEVAVLFNGQEHKENFPPSRTIGKILHWALNKFKLTGHDATAKSLFLTSEPSVALSESDHIGSFAKPHHCSVELNLANVITPNG